MHTNARGSIIGTLTYVLLFASAGFGLWSAYQNRAVHKELAETRATLGRAQRGDYIPLIEAPSLSEPARKLRIGAPATQQLVYFFSPDCRFCAQSAPFVERIYQRTRESGGEMFAVSLKDAESTGAYLRSTGSTIPTASVTDARTLGLLRVRAVPALALVEPGGKIKYIRYGVLGEQDVPAGAGAARSAH